jgi:hypothetical protein
MYAGRLHMDSLVEVCRIIGWCNRQKYAGENEDFISPGSL